MRYGRLHLRSAEQLSALRRYVDRANLILAGRRIASCAAGQNETKKLGPILPVVSHKIPVGAALAGGSQRCRRHPAGA